MTEPATPGSPRPSALASGDASAPRRRATPAGVSLTVAGRYRRRQRIAEGGSSSVHRAEDLETHREVALKSFHVHRAFDASLLPALRRAQAIAQRVGDAVLVPLLEVGADDDGTPFVVMPLLEGETLGSAAARAPLEPARAIAIATRLLASLDALHAAGATHGDLSPDNVFLTSDDRLLLLDHESIGALGAPRPERRTEGFGATGGVRETHDDHDALLALMRAITAGASSELDGGASARFIAALRRGANDEAAATLGLGRGEGFSMGRLSSLRWSSLALLLLALGLALVAAALILR